MIQDVGVAIGGVPSMRARAANLDHDVRSTQRSGLTGPFSPPTATMTPVLVATASRMSAVFAKVPPSRAGRINIGADGNVGERRWRADSQDAGVVDCLDHVEARLRQGKREPAARVAHGLREDGAPIEVSQPQADVGDRRFAVSAKHRSGKGAPALRLNGGSLATGLGAHRQRAGDAGNVDDARRVE